jgi:hypothetical protein
MKGCLQFVVEVRFVENWRSLATCLRPIEDAYLFKFLQTLS